MIHCPRVFDPAVAIAILGVTAGGPPPLHTLGGAAANDFLGAAVAAAGDVNGDGFGDVIAGAPGNDERGSEAGSAQVMSGRTGAVLPWIRA